MAEGEARILTLKDSRVLDNEGLWLGLLYVTPRTHTDLPFTSCFTEDELQNVEMAEEERRVKNTELKKAKKEYTGYDDDEFVDGQARLKRTVLAKYDEDLEMSETVSYLGTLDGAIFSELRIYRALDWAATSKPRLRQTDRLNSKRLRRSTNHCFPLTMLVSACPLLLA
jgi:hypothetical protein